MERVVLSGMRPTGRLHLGNYFGALENWVSLQDEYECFFFIADWHALTTGYEDTDDIKDNIYQIVTDWLSAGLDPGKCTMFLQSKIKEHAELHLLFSMSTPLSWLMRCPTYKDQIAQMKDRNITTYGFLGYPCLQAADILMYNARYVPVGEDQLPHLELTREIARRFNHLYGKVFREPQPLLTQAKVVPGTDGRKMSKSYGNTIYLSDSPDVLKKKISMMITDPERIKKDDPGHPEVCSVFSYHRIFNTDGVDNVQRKCRAGEIGCVQCKRNLTELVIEKLRPIYNRRMELEKNRDYIREVIEEGSERARKAAEANMKNIRRAMKIDW